MEEKERVHNIEDGGKREGDERGGGISRVGFGCCLFIGVVLVICSNL